MLAFFGVGLLELVWVVVRSALAIDPADVPAITGLVAALVAGMGIAIYLIQRDI